MENVPLLRISEVAALECKEESTIKKRVQSGKLEAETINGSRGGNGGITYRIPLSALSTETQVKYWTQIGANSTSASDMDIVGYQKRYGEEGLHELLDAQKAVQELTGMLTVPGKRGEIYAEVAQRHNVSARTLRRWEADYKARGLAGLMKPVERADKGESRTICAWAGDYLKFMYVGNQSGRKDNGNSKLCQEQALELLLEAAANLGDEACDNCPYCEGSERRNELNPDKLSDFPPCSNAAGHRMIVPENRYAVNRFMKGIPPQLVTYGRYGGRAWEAQFMQKVRRDKPVRVNECWFGDHHKFDLFVLGENGVPFRPWLTAWSDATSGKFVGWMLTAEPNSDTIAESFCRAAAYTVNSDVHGLPNAIYCDNGKDYRSERFEGGKFVERDVGKLNERFNPDSTANTPERSLLEMFDVTMIRAKPYQAWSKTIERLFGTLEMRWIRELPGWCGYSPKERPQNFDRELSRLANTGELLTFETFAKIWINKILPAYHAFATDGSASPDEIYRIAERYPGHTPSWDTLALFKSMSDTRKVETTGIRYDKRRYWNPALADYIGQWVTIRYNRGYNESITVMRDSRYICEADMAENMQLIEPDQDKLVAHMKAQAGQRRKVTNELARLSQAMKGVNVRAAYAEEIDEQRDRREATFVSLEAQRAASGKSDAVDRRTGRRKAAAAGADEVMNMLEMRGKALYKEG